MIVASEPWWHPLSLYNQEYWLPWGILGGACRAVETQAVWQYESTDNLRVCGVKKADETYLIICNNKLNKVLCKCFLREWRKKLPDCIMIIMAGFIVWFCCTCSCPAILAGCIVIYLGMQLEKVILEVHCPSRFLIKKVGDSFCEFGLIMAVKVAAKFVRKGDVIRNVVLTCISGRLSPVPPH